MNRATLAALPLPEFATLAHQARTDTAARYGWPPPSPGRLPRWLLVEMVLTAEHRRGTAAPASPVKMATPSGATAGGG